MAVRTRLKGAKSIRRIMRAVPDTMSAELVHVLNDTGPKMARQMQARTPRRTGALAAGIKWKVMPKTLKMQVGLLGTKRGRAKLFYGFILNYGRKAKTVRAKRRNASGSVSVYPLRVRAYPAQHFVTGAMPDLRRMMQERLRAVWDKVLTKAATGVGNE